MDTNLEAMNERKRFFETRGKEVFDLLESAINYAALCHPDEFFERRDQIAQVLFARQQQQQPRIHASDQEEDTTANSSDFSDTALLRMKEYRAEGCLFASKKSSCESKPDSAEIVVSDSEKCPASGNIGTGTEDKEPKRRHIIRIKLRPKPNKEEQFPALEEADSRVAIEAKEKEPETKCDAEVKLPVPHRVPKKSCTTAAEVGIMTRKFSEKSSERKITEKNRVMINEQKSMCSDFDVKLEASKRKLHEGYKQFEDAKREKKIRMIESKDLRRGGVGCGSVAGRCITSEAIKADQ